MSDPTLWGFTALVIAALLVGFAKTAIGGVAAISVAIFAAVLPALESTGALLPLLLVGDLFAIHAYRRHADWGVLVRLFPSVAVGVGVGTVFMALVDDTVMRRTIGAILLVIVGVHVWQQRRRSPGESPPAPHIARTTAFGLAAGFTTMVANAGGSVMALYLLSAGFAMMGFLGTGAWFFFAVNLFKLPFSVGLGLITVDSLILNLWLAPAVVVGALIGKAVIHRMDQSLFSRLVLIFTTLSALNLLR
ncbi:TSUP family transporter [Streptomyces alkaliphilus]|uniref:Probable membrane transporter protein n=1 Tax=Streptomyces alkaliphilus TaxID=1472722 RepID=A0A7W3Y0V9_9ACTN|nr:sulfite exporter TauE/SafE family protein [Streptomyces alkaliphilus]MBB0243672.1 TSUP family transporter [Streptomyces alkaliphilus]